MKKKVAVFKEIESYDQLQYPEDFGAVMRGDAYWYPEPIKILDWGKKFFNFHTWQYVDMDHPKCYYCGRFVKTGNWWKGLMTGPCWVCDDDLTYY